MFEISEERQVAKNDFVFEEGHMADVLMVIAMGRAEIVRQKQVLATLGIGEVLGELSLFTHAHKRSASAKALTDMTVLCVPSIKFRKLVDSGNLAALKVVNNLAHQMSERLLVLNDKLLAATGKKDLVDARNLTW